MIYKCTALTTFQPRKVYISLAEGEFKTQRYYIIRYYNSKQELFEQHNSLQLRLENKERKKETPTLEWEIIRTAPPYTNITNIISNVL